MAAAFILASCETDKSTNNESLDLDEENVKASLVQIQPGSSSALSTSSLGVSCVELKADMGALATGTVCASVKGDSLQIASNPSEGYGLLETRLWGGTATPTQLLNGGGNPVVENFPAIHTGLSQATTDTLRLALAVFGLSQSMSSCEPVLAHLVAYARLKDEHGGAKTAYAMGSELPKPNKVGMNEFTFLLECLAPPERHLACESGFAYGGDLAIAFNTLEKQPANRWGWTNGPLDDGSYELTLYAHAAQNDLGKGLAIGSVEVTVEGDEVDVEFRKIDDGPEVWYVHTQLYVGSTPLPLGPKGAYTAAPGQYGLQDELDTVETYTYHVTGSGPFYIAAKAKACQERD